MRAVHTESGSPARPFAYAFGEGPIPFTDFPPRWRRLLSDPTVPDLDP